MPTFDPTWNLAHSRLDDLRAEAGHQRRVRLARPDDRGAVRAFLGRLSPRTVQARYLSPLLPLDDARADLEVARLFDSTDFERTIVLAMDGADVRGIGEFSIEDAERAELGLIVEDAFQGRGIGKRLLRALERLAIERGLRAFTGDVAVGNSRGLAVLRATGRPLHSRPDYGSVRFTLRLD
jgi:GNAT superfamily N-acetyltransferase